jgi:hypothetical protein
MRARLVIGLVFAALALGWLRLSRREAVPTASPGPTAVAPPPAHEEVTPPPATTEDGAGTRPFGERILDRYAEAARPPEEDLHDLARTLGNLALLVKGDDPLPLGANEEIAAALRGKNKARLRALPDDHRAFNAQGQLVDRWNTPLYFHAASRDRLDVRSAGPDRKMWTADDLHRRHDGRFLRGEALLAPSLYEEGRAPR